MAVPRVIGFDVGIQCALSTGAPFRDESPIVVERLDEQAPRIIAGKATHICQASDFQTVRRPPLRRARCNQPQVRGVHCKQLSGQGGDSIQYRRNGVQRSSGILYQLDRARSGVLNARADQLLQICARAVCQDPYQRAIEQGQQRPRLVTDRRQQTTHIVA